MGNFFLIIITMFMVAYVTHRMTKSGMIGDAINFIKYEIFKVK